VVNSSLFRSSGIAKSGGLDLAIRAGLTACLTVNLNFGGGPGLF